MHLAAGTQKIYGSLVILLYIFLIQAYQIWHRVYSYNKYQLITGHSKGQIPS